MVVCSRFCSEKIVYNFIKTSNDHKFCSGYRKRTNFISIWDIIEFSLECPTVVECSRFVVQNLRMSLVKFQMAITFTLVIKTVQILYRFRVELKLSNTSKIHAMSTMVVGSSFSCGKLLYVFSKTSIGHVFCFGYQNRANFIWIWDKIEISMQCLLWYCVVCSAKFVYVFSKTSNGHHFCSNY